MRVFLKCFYTQGYQTFSLLRNKRDQDFKRFGKHIKHITSWQHDKHSEYALAKKMRKISLQRGAPAMITMYSANLQDHQPQNLCKFHFHHNISSCSFKLPINHEYNDATKHACCQHMQQILLLLFHHIHVSPLPFQIRQGLHKTLMGKYSGCFKWLAGQYNKSTSCGQ
jgi:hypothetical protein